MASYEKVTNAGNVAGRNVFKARFATNPCSDIPQLQAWDDYQMDSVDQQVLAGTDDNTNKPLVAAASTDAAAVGAPWVPTNPVAGGSLVNRLRGQENFTLLGATAPATNEERRFTLAMGCAPDSALGTNGNSPVFAVKAFYAGAPPDISFFYNKGVDDLGAGAGADWQLMTSENKGTAMSIGVKNAIHAAGPSGASPQASLQPVVKPGVNEKWAEEYWIQTSL